MSTLTTLKLASMETSKVKRSNYWLFTHTLRKCSEMVVDWIIWIQFGHLFFTSLAVTVLFSWLISDTQAYMPLWKNQNYWTIHISYLQSCVDLIIRTHRG